MIPTGDAVGDATRTCNSDSVKKSLAVKMLVEMRLMFKPQKSASAFFGGTRTLRNLVSSKAETKCDGLLEPSKEAELRDEQDEKHLSPMKSTFFGISIVSRLVHKISQARRKSERLQTGAALECASANRLHISKEFGR
mgnify:CR=1 FL=1